MPVLALKKGAASPGSASPGDSASPEPTPRRPSFQAGKAGVRGSRRSGKDDDIDVEEVVEEEEERPQDKLSPHTRAKLKQIEAYNSSEGKDARPREYIVVPHSKLVVLKESLEDGGGVEAAFDVGTFKEGMHLCAGGDLDLEAFDVVGLDKGDEIDQELRPLVLEALQVLIDEGHSAMFVVREADVVPDEPLETITCFCIKRRKWSVRRRLRDRLWYGFVALETSIYKTVYHKQQEARKHDVLITSQHADKDVAEWVRTFCQKRGMSVHYTSPLEEAREASRQDQRVDDVLNPAAAMPPCIQWLQKRRQEVQSSCIVVAVVSNDCFDNMCLVQDCLFAWQWGVPILAVKRNRGGTNVAELRKRVKWVFQNGNLVPDAGQGASRQRLTAILTRAMVRGLRSSGNRQKRSKALPPAMDDILMATCKRLQAENAAENKQDEGSSVVSDSLSGTQSEMKSTTIGGDEEENKAPNRKKSITSGLEGVHRRGSQGSAGIEIVVDPQPQAKNSLTNSSSGPEVTEEEEEDKAKDMADPAAEYYQTDDPEAKLRLPPALEQSVYGVISVLAQYGRQFRGICVPGTEALRQVSKQEKGSYSIAEFGGIEVLLNTARLASEKVAGQAHALGPDVLGSARSAGSDDGSSSNLPAMHSPSNASGMMMQKSSTGGHMGRDLTTTTATSGMVHHTTTMTSTGGGRRCFFCCCRRNRNNLNIELEEDALQTEGSPGSGSPSSPRSRKLGAAIAASATSKLGSMASMLSPKSPTATSSRSFTARLSSRWANKAQEAARRERLEETTIAEHCLMGLRNLACRSSDRKARIIAVGGSSLAHMAMRVFREETNGDLVRRAVSGLLRNISSGTDQGHFVLTGDGILELAKEELSHSGTSADIKRHMLAAVQNMASHDVDAHDVFKAMGISRWIDLCSDTMLKAMERREASVMQQALGALGNLSLLRSREVAEEQAAAAKRAEEEAKALEEEAAAIALALEAPEELADEAPDGAMLTARGSRQSGWSQKRGGSSGTSGGSSSSSAERGEGSWSGSSPRSGRSGSPTKRSRWSRQTDTTEGDVMSGSAGAASGKKASAKSSRASSAASGSTLRASASAGESASPLKDGSSPKKKASDASPKHASSARSSASSAFSSSGGASSVTLTSAPVRASEDSVDKSDREPKKAEPQPTEAGGDTKEGEASDEDSWGEHDALDVGASSSGGFSGGWSKSSSGGLDEDNPAKGRKSSGWADSEDGMDGSSWGGDQHSEAHHSSNSSASAWKPQSSSSGTLSLPTDIEEIEESVKRAEMKVPEEIIERMLRLLEPTVDDALRGPHTMAANISTLTNFAQDEDIERLIGKMGGVKVVLAQLVRTRSWEVQLQCMRFLWNMSYSRTNQAQMLDQGGAFETILHIMNTKTQQADAALHEQASGIIRNLATGSARQKRKLFAMGAVPALCNVMKRYPRESGPLLQASDAIRILAHNAPPVSEQIVSVDGVRALCTALAQSGEDFELTDSLLQTIEVIFISPKVLQPFLSLYGHATVLECFTRFISSVTYCRASRVIASALYHHRGCEETAMKLRIEINERGIVGHFIQLAQDLSDDLALLEEIARTLLNFSVNIKGVAAAKNFQLKSQLANQSDHFIKLVNHWSKKTDELAESARFAAMMITFLASIALEIEAAGALYRFKCAESCLQWISIWKRNLNVERAGCTLMMNLSASQLRAREMIVRHGGMGQISVLLSKHFKRPEAICDVLRCLHNLSTSPLAQNEIQLHGIIEKIMAVSDAHFSKEALQEAAYALLWNMSLQVELAEEIVEVGITPMACDAMGQFIHSPGLIVATAGLLRNLVSDEELGHRASTEIQEAGGFKVLFDGLWEHCHPHLDHELRKADQFATPESTAVAEQLLACLANISDMKDKNFCLWLTMELETDKEACKKFKLVLEEHPHSQMVQYQGFKLLMNLLVVKKDLKLAFSGFGKHVRLMLKKHHKSKPILDLGDLLLEEVA